MSLVRDLHKVYSSKQLQFTLNIPELQLPDRGVTAIWGESGSGKTTLFRILLGLEEAKGMSWVHAGVDLAALPVEKRQLGVVFQTLELFPHMTAEQNIQFAGRARGLSRSEVIARQVELAAALEIENLLDKNVQTLSGGQKQRVAIARALVAPVRYLLLDEPFSSLDSGLRVKARELVKRVVNEFDIPTLLVTHDQQDVDALADKVIQIRDGVIVESAGR